jgi:hypothetical protein
MSYEVRVDGKTHTVTIEDIAKYYQDQCKKLPRRQFVQIKEKYDDVFEVFNASDEWLDVYIEYCPEDMFRVVRVVGGDEDGNPVDAIDRYDWLAELSIEEAIAEQMEPDL